MKFKILTTQNRHLWPSVDVLVVDFTLQIPPAGGIGTSAGAGAVGAGGADADELDALS